MFKPIFLALTVCALSSVPALAQGWLDAGGTGETTGNSSYATGSRNALQAGLGYQMRKPGDQTTPGSNSGGDNSGLNNGMSAPASWGDIGVSRRTSNQGMRSPGNDQGPDMKQGGVGDRSNMGFMSNTGSGAAMGGPIIMSGLNTYMAPSNLALQTQYGGRGMGRMRLPQTNLDSFVHKARNKGLAEFIYGNEGVYDKPPRDWFIEIEPGIESGDLSTGHPSDAPSAWSYPLKYNQFNPGPIQGQ